MRRQLGNAGSEVRVFPVMNQNGEVNITVEVPTGALGFADDITLTPEAARELVTRLVHTLDEMPDVD